MKSPNHLPVHVNNPFGQIWHAVVHDGRNAENLEDNRWADKLPGAYLHPETGAVDKKILQEQLKGMHEELEARGVILHREKNIRGQYCQLFTADHGVAIGGLFFVCSLFDDYREKETKGLEPISARMNQKNVIDLRKEGSNVKFEGGDVVVVRKDLVLVGTGQKTNVAGMEALRKHLEPLGIKVVHVPHTALHLDSAALFTPDGRLLYSKRHLPKSSRAIIRAAMPHIKQEPLDPRESENHLAANVVWVNPKVVISSSDVPRTNDLLARGGVEVVEKQCDQIVHQWSGFSGTVLPFVRDDQE